MPTAFTVSMLAWGALAFPNGYQKAHQMPHVLQTMRWGSDYLMKTWKPDTLGPSSAGYLIIYQVQLPASALLLCCQQALRQRTANLATTLCIPMPAAPMISGALPVRMASMMRGTVPEPVWCMGPHLQWDTPLHARLALSAARQRAQEGLNMGCRWAT